MTTTTDSNPIVARAAAGTSEDRRALHAYVSDYAHDQWHGWAAEQGVSVSALLEAMADDLDGDGPAAGESLGLRLARWALTARRIDAARRRRRR
jgi:hypothetical protein